MRFKSLRGVIRFYNLNRHERVSFNAWELGNRTGVWVLELTAIMANETFTLYDKRFMRNLLNEFEWQIYNLGSKTTRAHRSWLELISFLQIIERSMRQ